MRVAPVVLFARATVELGVIEGILADDAIPREGASGATLRAWAAVAALAAPAPDEEAEVLPLPPSQALTSLSPYLPPSALDTVRADLTRVEADPYLLLERSAVVRHAEWLRACLTTLAAERALVPVPPPGFLARHRGWVAVAAVAGCAAVGLGALLRRAAPWRAAYFPNVELRGEPRLQFDRHLDFDWTGRRPRYDLVSSNYSVRWVSCLHLDRAETVTFTLGSDDGSRLFVDGALAIDGWTDHGYAETEADRVLAAGAHAIRVEYYQKGGDARCRLALGDRADPHRPLEDRLQRPPEPFDEKAPCP